MWSDHHDRVRVQLATDADLYDRATSGDRNAVALVVQRYHQQLTAFGRAWGWNEHEVQDAVQIMWMKFFQVVRAVQAGEDDGLAEPDRLRAWLACILRNALHDQYRRTRRQVGLTERAAAASSVADLVAEPDFLEGIEIDERRSLLRRAFARLGHTCRQLLGLMLIDPPLSYADVAAVMGKPVGSIGPTRQRCIDTVKSILVELT